MKPLFQSMDHPYEGTPNSQGNHIWFSHFFHCNTGKWWIKDALGGQGDQHLPSRISRIIV
jgi:hypothetical protein